MLRLFACEIRRPRPLKVQARKGDYPLFDYFSVVTVGSSFLELVTLWATLYWVHLKILLAFSQRDFPSQMNSWAVAPLRSPKIGRRYLYSTVTAIRPRATFCGFGKKSQGQINNAESPGAIAAPSFRLSTVIGYPPPCGFTLTPSSLISVRIAHVAWGRLSSKNPLLLIIANGASNAAEESRDTGSIVGVIGQGIPQIWIILAHRLSKKAGSHIEYRAKRYNIGSCGGRDRRFAAGFGRYFFTGVADFRLRRKIQPIPTIARPKFSKCVFMFTENVSAAPGIDTPQQRAIAAPKISVFSRLLYRN